MLESEKVGLPVWSPLAGGLRSGKYSQPHQKPADSRRFGSVAFMVSEIGSVQR